MSTFIKNIKTSLLKTVTEGLKPKNKRHDQDFVVFFNGVCQCSYLASDSCNLDCVREKMKQKLQSAMRTLRKSINKQQFYIQFSGTEYEVAQKPSRVPEGAEACSTGQVLREGKCGKSCFMSAGVMMLVSCPPVIMRSYIKYSVSTLCAVLLSKLWCGDVLQRGAGAVCPVSPRYLPGHGRSTVL